ncbi:unnamed protein product, partial [Urochloa humidicola]
EGGDGAARHNFLVPPLGGATIRPLLGGAAMAWSPVTGKGWRGAGVAEVEFGGGVEDRRPWLRRAASRCVGGYCSSKARRSICNGGAQFGGSRVRIGGGGGRFEE